MFQILLVFHIIICILLILIVLMQTGIGSQLGAAFGGAGQVNQIQTPENLIGKLTTVLAMIFIVTSVFLAVLSSNDTSVLEKEKSQTTNQSQ